MKTLSKAPAQRFEAMEFVVNALEGFTTSSRRSWAEVPLGGDDEDGPGAAARHARGAHAGGDHPADPGGGADGEATTLSSRKRRRLRWPPVAALAVAFTAAGILVYGRVTQPIVVSPSATSAEGTLPSARATLLTEVPAGTHSPEALAAYRSFQQNLRDADWKAAIDALSTAVERDPSFAAAQLRLAFMRSLESVDEGQVRSTFMLAVHNRSTLDERDAALLDALAPYLQSDPSDPAESERRLVDVRRRWSLDAEIAYMLGSVCYDRGELSCALEAFDAALAIDPGFALAASSRGGCLAYAGRADEARAALESATRLSRGATEPLWYLVELDEQQGRCADEEAHVRTWLSRDPSDWFGYDYLARALAAEGKPASTVLTAFEQKWVRLEPDHRAKIEPMDRAYLDVATGDFADAEQRIQELQKMLATEPGAQAHAESQALLVRIAEESGQPARARGRGRGVPGAQGRLGPEPPGRRGLHLLRRGARDARCPGPGRRVDSLRARPEASGVARRVAREDGGLLPGRPLAGGVGRSCHHASGCARCTGCALVLRRRSGVRPQPRRAGHRRATSTCSPIASTTPWTRFAVGPRRAPSSSTRRRARAAGSTWARHWSDAATERAPATRIAR